MKTHARSVLALILCLAQGEASAQVVRAAAALRTAPAPLGLPPSLPLSAPAGLAPTLPALPSPLPSLPAPAAPTPQAFAPTARAASPAAALAAASVQAPSLIKGGAAAKAAAGAHFEGARAGAAAASVRTETSSRLLRPTLAALPPAGYLSQDLESAVLRIAAAFDGAAALPAEDTAEAYRPGAPAEKAEFEAVRSRTALRLAAAPRETRKRVAAALDLEFGQILANRAAQGLFAEAGDLARAGAAPERVAGALRRAQEFDRDGGLLYAERMALVMSLRAQDPAFRAFSEDLSAVIRAMSRDGSGEGEPRMNWVRKNAVFSAAAEASAGFRVGKSLRFLRPEDPLDIARPSGAAWAMRKLLASLEDAKPAVFTWTGTVRAKGSLEPLFRVVGMSVRAASAVEDPARGKGFRIVSREVMLYLDARTGEVLKTWRNPFTGETVAVFPVANDPVNFPPVFESDARFPGRLKGEEGLLRFEVPVSYPNPLSGPRYAEYGGEDPVYRSKETFSFDFTRTDLASPGDQAFPTGTWEREGPWLPWMKMGARAGGLQYEAAMRKASDLSDVPEPLLSTVRREFPAFLTPPPADDPRPNETTWTAFKRHLDASAGAPQTRIRHGFPPFDALLRLWLGRRETALRGGFELAGGRGEVPVFLYGERHTDAGLIKANMERLRADLEPGRPHVLLIEGYPAGKTMPLIDAFRYLKTRGFDLEALRAKGISLKDGDLVIRGWDDPAHLERGMEMARRYASKLARLKKLAAIDSLGSAGPLERLARAARFYATFVPLAFDMLREWRSDRRFLVTERNKDLDRALRDAVNEATWTGGTVHVVAGAHHLLERPLMAEVPLLGGLRLRRSLGRALAGASWRASEAPSTLPIRTWAETIDEMGAFYHGFDASALRAAAAAARDKLKFMGAFLGVARDFSRTDLIFDFADTASVEKSPSTATLIARMRQDPAVRALMDERRLMPRLDLDALAALPPDTLGGAYGRYMKKNGFTPDFYKPIDTSSEYGWLAVWARQTHDFWHTAAGYTPSNADEVALQAFGMPQFPTAQLPAVIIAAGLLNAARENPEGAGTLVRSIAHAYGRGARTRGMVPTRWDLRLEAPLAEVRRELGIPARTDGGPTEAGQEDPRRAPPRHLSRLGALAEDLRVLAVLAGADRPAPARLDSVRAAAAAAVRGERSGPSLRLIAAELLRAGLNAPEGLPALMEALADGAGL